MRGMKLVAALSALTVTGALTAPAQAIVLPPPVEVANSLTYGDFTIYSLAYLHFQANGTDPFNPGSEYYVSSSSGQVKDSILIGVGSEGTKDNAAGMDDAYETPNAGGNSAAANFSTLGQADPGGAGEFGGDGADTWDIRLSTLNDYLAGDDVVFYFNLNETNKDGVGALATSQDALVWGQVIVHAENGDVLGTFDLNGINPVLNAATNYGSYDFDGVGGEAAKNDVGYVHGQICVDSNTNVLAHLGACTNADPASYKSVNQNLGKQQAAFALTNNDLSDLIHSLGDAGYMTVDLRFGELSNGYETVFMNSYQRYTPPSVPEPATLALLGAGLLGLGLARRRKP